MKSSTSRVCQAGLAKIQVEISCDFVPICGCCSEEDPKSFVLVVDIGNPASMLDSRKAYSCGAGTLTCRLDAPRLGRSHRGLRRAGTGGQYLR